MAINSASLEWVYLWTCTQICGHWIPTSPRKMGSGAARTWPEVRTYTCCCCWSEHSLLPGCRCQGHERQVPSTAQGKAHAPSAHIPCLCTLRGGDSNLNLASWQPLPWLEGFFFWRGWWEAVGLTTSARWLWWQKPGPLWTLAGWWWSFIKAWSIITLWPPEGHGFTRNAGQKAPAPPTAYRFLESTTYVTTLENKSTHFSFLTDNKVQGKQNELFTVSKAFQYSITSNSSIIITTVIITLRLVPKGTALPLRKKKISTQLKFRVCCILFFFFFGFSMYWSIMEATLKHLFF